MRWEIEKTTSVVRLQYRAEECVENIQRITVSSLHGRKKLFLHPVNLQQRKAVGN